MAEEDTTTFADYEARVIRLTEERRTHILDHPEMADQLDRVAETLAGPDVVVSTSADETVHVYHKRYAQTPVTEKFLLVAVKVLGDDAFMLTAFFSNRQKKGVTLWPR
jgi:hypothetical protein